MVRATLAIVATLCTSFVAAEQAVNPPPQPLHKVDDHWSPYQAPTEFPSDAKVYIIQKGDTLWALAQKYLGNPYLWPQLWEKNKYIRDAHWIYPGDPLVVGLKATEVAPTPAPTLPGAPRPGADTEAARLAGAAGAGAGAGAAGAGVGAGAAGAGAGAAMPSAALPEGKLVAVGGEDDVYCFAYLEPKSVKAQLKVVSAERVDSQDDFTVGDIVYVSGGEQDGVKAGQEYTVVVSERRLNHPVTRAHLGDVFRSLGRLRILCAQEHTASAEIIASCDSIPLGAELKPFEPIPIPMTVLTPPRTACDPSSNRPRGTIIYAKDDAVSFGRDHMVLIDLGEADQLAPGSVCTVYRDNPIKGAPALVLGEAAVITAGEHWASAKIIRSKTQMHAGDRVELK